MPTLAEINNMSREELLALLHKPIPPPSYSESDFPIPTWKQRLLAMRPMSVLADPGMVAKTPNTSESLTFDMSLRPLWTQPRPTTNDPSKLPSYQSGTDYVPEDTTAMLHEGEMVIPADEATKLRKKRAEIDASIPLNLNEGSDHTPRGSISTEKIPEFEAWRKQPEPWVQAYLRRRAAPWTTKWNADGSSEGTTDTGVHFRRSPTGVITTDLHEIRDPFGGPPIKMANSLYNPWKDPAAFDTVTGEPLFGWKSRGNLQVVKDYYEGKLQPVQLRVTEQQFPGDTVGKEVQFAPSNLPYVGWSIPGNTAALNNETLEQRLREGAAAARAHPLLYSPPPSYEEGTDYVPETGPAEVHKGEMIVPKDKADELRRAQVTVTAKAPTLTFEEMKKRWMDKGYPEAAAEGIADNMVRESGGKTTATGDGGKSGGLFQHQGQRLTALKVYAEEQKKPWTDPDVQIDFADKEMKEQYPSLRKSLMAADNRSTAQDQFKRIFERPQSVMWENRPEGGPVLGTGRYQFSDYALGEHEKRRRSSLFYMDPQDYLDLSPDLEGKPFDSASGKSLKASVDRGDKIEAVPTLDMKVDGQTGTITGQDGRHRALLAQEEGVEAIPVAVNQRGSGTPSEIVGMGGKVLPFDFRPAADVQRGPSPVSRALTEAAQTATPLAADIPPWEQTADRPPWEQEAAPAPAPARPEPGVMERFGTGLLDLPVGAAQFVGNVAGGLGEFLPGKQGQDARDFRERLNAAVAAREGRIQEGRGPDAGIDWARMGGNVVGTLPLAALGPGGLATAAGRGIVAGAAGGALQPVTQGPFWTGKAEQAVEGAAAGGTLGALGAGLARTVGPSLNSLARKLMNEGVQLTPGQMAGGAVKRAEDAMMSIPVLGSAIRSARQRSLQTFNNAAINRSLSDVGGQVPSGLVGHEAIASAQEQFSKAYNAVIPRMVGREDLEFKADILNVVARATDENLPEEYMAQLHHIIGTEIVRRFNAGAGRITGEDAQKIGTQLDALRKAMRISPNPYQQHLARLLGGVDDAIDNMMARNNPTLQAAKDRIDAGYSKFKIVQQASRYAGTSPDGTFTPAQLNQAVLARDRSKDKAAFARGDALMQDLAVAAKDVLPSKVPDSGTPERLMMMDMLRHARDIGAGGAAYYMNPWVLGGLLGGAAPYTKLGIAGINNIARSPATKNFLANLGRGSASVGAATAPSGDTLDIPTITVRPQPPAPQIGP